MNTAGELVASGPFAGVMRPRRGFQTVMADPPWGWRTWNALDKVPHRGEVAPYEPMTKQDLEALPVRDLVGTNAAVFMWTVSSHLDQAVDLMRAWGFTYRSVAFIWVKVDKQGRPRMSLGRWTRQEAELCLIGTTGRPPRLSGGVRQVIMAPRREHSRKPDEAYRRARELVGGPYLELFSREERPGWSTWGDERGKFDAIHAATPAEQPEWIAATAGSPDEAVPVACWRRVPGRVCNCPRCDVQRRAIMQALRG